MKSIAPKRAAAQFAPVIFRGEPCCATALRSSTARAARCLARPCCSAVERPLARRFPRPATPPRSRKPRRKPRMATRSSSPRSVAPKISRTCRSRSPRSRPRRSTSFRSMRSTICPARSVLVVQVGWAGVVECLFPRRCVGRECQSLGLAAKRRHLSRRVADHDHHRRAGYPRLRHCPRRSARGSARHALRRVEPGRDDPHHHQQARFERHLWRGECRAQQGRAWRGRLHRRGVRQHAFVKQDCASRGRLEAA